MLHRFIENIRKHLKTYVITLVVSIVVGLAIFFLYYFLKGQDMLALLDGTGVAGVALLGAGLLCLVARLGAFDTMSYGFRQMFSSMFAKEANQYNNMADYKEDRRIKRESASYYYIVMMVVSALFFIAFIALEIYRSTLR